MNFSQFRDFNHFKATMGLDSKDACLLLLKEIEKRGGVGEDGTNKTTIIW